MNRDAMKYYIRQAFKSLKKNKLTTAASISTTAATLFILGVLLAFSMNVSDMARQFSRDCEIQVFINENSDIEQYDKIGDKTIANMTNGVDSIPFRKFAEEFDYIKDETVSVVINNNEETEKLLSQLEYGGINAKRRLQRYSVSLKIKGEFDKALSLGLLTDTGKGLYVLADNTYYDTETGLDINKSSDYIF